MSARTLFFIVFVLLKSFGVQATNYTSIANGDSDDPTIWTPSLPNPNIAAGDTVFINHEVELKDNLNISGALVINGSGFLFGNKEITVNSNGYLLNDGEMDMDKKVENSGKFFNNGTFYTKKEFINNSGGILFNAGSFTVRDEIDNSGVIQNQSSLITQDEFINNAGGTVTNTANLVVFKDFENFSNVINSGTIGVLGKFKNMADGNLISNGTVNVSDDIENEGTIQNSGNINTSADFKNEGTLQNSGNVNVDEEYHNDGQTFNSGNISADNVHDDGYTCNSGIISVDPSEEYRCHACTIDCNGQITACLVEVEDGSDVSNQNFCCTDGTDTDFAFETNYAFDSTTVFICGAPLPIELLSFTATALDNGANEISWVTATEKDNDYFVVEKSIDGVNWNEMAKVQGAGTSEITLIYSVRDTRVSFGINYYRLKQVDFNGDFKYFKTVTVKNTVKENKLTVYPNPSSDYVNINSKKAIELEEIKLFSLHGENLLSRNDIQEISQQELRLNLTSLPNGIYLLQYKDEIVRIIKSQ